MHCDLNSLNIIGEKKDDKNVEFKAIIDFGDVCGSAFMFDLAICLIYMMVAAKVQNGDYYNIATQVYLGYISARSLRYFVCMHSHIHLIWIKWDRKKGFITSCQSTCCTKCHWWLLHSIDWARKSRIFDEWMFGSRETSSWNRWRKV